MCACLFREFQLSASYEGLIETVPGVNQELLRMDNYEIDKSKDALFRGEFEVVKELLEAFQDGAASKRECDKVIDKNGPKPKGTGIKQLRENIAESKLSYEIMDDAAQAFLKTKIMDNIQKYFYLICFTGYLREQSVIAKDGVTEEEKKTFALTGGKGTQACIHVLHHSRRIYLYILCILATFSSEHADGEPEAYKNIPTMDGRPCQFQGDL